MVRLSQDCAVHYLIIPAGNLALSRALGDFTYKRNNNIPVEAQIITSNPDITEHKITEEDEFLIIACDGTAILWCCFGSQYLDVLQVSGTA